MIPLRQIDSNFVPLEILKKFERNVEKDFFFDIEGKELK